MAEGETQDPIRGEVVREQREDKRGSGSTSEALDGRPSGEVVQALTTIEQGQATAFAPAPPWLANLVNAQSWLSGQRPLPQKPPAPSPPIPSLRVAVFLPWRQVWTLKGLSRGRLLHSLSLAPQEETTIELFTWERHKKTLEQSSQTDTEQTVEGTDSTKDTSDVYTEVNRQRDFQWQVSGSLRATYRPVAGEITVGAQSEAQNKTAIAEIGKTTQNRVHETVLKASTKVRAQRVTKISETTEWGSEQRVTRKVRNPNMCHTLNLDYYEVLAHYEIETTFLPNDARLCAFVGNPLSTEKFTPEFVRRNETALSDALLDGALREGFEACRTLAAYAEALTEIKARRAEAAKAAALGSPTEPPKPPPTSAAKSKEEIAVISALKDLKASAEQFTSGDLDPHPALTAIGQHERLEDATRLNARRWLYRTLVEARFASFAAELRLLKTKTDAELDIDYARRLATLLPSPVGSPTLATLGDLSDSEKENLALARVIRDGHMAAEWDWAWWSGQCRDESLFSPDDMGIPARVQRLHEKWQALDAKAPVERTQEEGAKLKGEADARQDQQAAEDVLEMKFPLEQLARARERASILLAHLTDHAPYYRFALFQALPPSEQLVRLIDSSKGVLRVGMFEPRVVSSHGDDLAVPLNTSNYPELEAFLANMADGVKETEPSIATILLPTPGMSIESRLGRCSGCEEFIEQSRAIELRRLSAVADQAEREAVAAPVS
jgi:hypothetical protein